jgi:hypothetical protein
MRQMDPGTYYIELRSRNAGGALWSRPVRLNFEVNNYWYESPALRWIFALAVLGIFSMILLQRRRKYSTYIAKLNQGLQMEKQELEKRDADLQEVKQEVKNERRQLRLHMLSIEVLHRLMFKITPGMKWDEMMEIISVDLLKLPGVVAFEIGLRDGKYINFEGYSEWVRNFTNDRVTYDPNVNLAAYCMEQAKPFIFNHLVEEASKQISNWDRRLHRYKSAISVPFFHESRQAVLSIYSDKEELFDDYALKAMSVFVTYLEQIS